MFCPLPQSLLTDPNPESPANVDAAKVSRCAHRSTWVGSRAMAYLCSLCVWPPQLWQSDKKMYRRKVRRVAAKTLE